MQFQTFSSLAIAPPYGTWRTLLGVCLAILACQSDVAGADRKAGPKSAPPTAFDIPSQPLPKALDAFSTATGIEILVDARNAQEGLSVPVKGVMPARRALRIILGETRLVAEEFTPGTITLMIASAARDNGVAAAPDPAYFAIIQRAVLTALCRMVATAPGDYRLALRLEVGADGSVSQSKLLNVTGSVDRDEAVKLALAGLKIGGPPPRYLPQPIAIVIQPRRPGSPAACPPKRPSPAYQ